MAEGYVNRNYVLVNIYYFPESMLSKFRNLLGLDQGQ